MTDPTRPPTTDTAADTTQPPGDADRGHTQPLLSVWPTGRVDPRTVLADRGYHPDTAGETGLMLAAIAEHAITTLSRPGDLVLDPDCGAGTTIVEALRAGRHAIGLTGQHREWKLARANVTSAKRAGAAVDGMVLVLDRRPDTIAAARAAGFTEHVALLLTAPQPTGPADLPAALRRLRTLLRQCRPLLRSGGHVVITTPPWRDPDTHHLIDLPGQILTAGIDAGLTPIARCVALTAAPRGHHVRTHADLADRRRAQRATHALGKPVALTAHHNVLIFRANCRHRQ